MDGEALLIASSVYARFLLGGVLLWAGVSKLRQSAPLVDTIAAFGLLPYRIAAIAARCIPPIELGLGILLIAGLGTRWVAATTLLLLGIFTLVIAGALVGGHRPHCNCFGRSETAISGLTIYRNISLMAIGGLIVIASTSPFSLDAALIVEDRFPDPSLGLMVIAAVLGGQVMAAWLGIREAIRYFTTALVVNEKG